MSIQSQAETFLSQKRIAVVGVKRKPGTGNAILKALRKRGYDVVAIHPQAAELEGEKCFPSVKDVDGGIDAVVIATRPEVAEAVVKDCVEAGVAHVWMHHNALFGAKSSSVSEAAASYGREHGLEVIAGGCPLMFGEGADFGHRCMKWWLGITGKLP